MDLLIYQALYGQIPSALISKSIQYWKRSSSLVVGMLSASDSNPLLLGYSSSGEKIKISRKISVDSMQASQEGIKLDEVIIRKKTKSSELTLLNLFSANPSSPLGEIGKA